MTSLDDVAAAARAQADAYGQEQYARGRTDQAADDKGLIDSLNASVAKWQSDYRALQAEFDQYKRDNPPGGGDPDPPPPPPAKTVIGMNFPPTAQVNEDRAGIGRVYVADNQTDMHKEPEYAQGLGLGIKRWVFSWKNISTTTLGTCLDSVKRDSIVHYDVKNHEPENDMGAAAWQAIQAAYMPVVRAHGGIPTSILMQYTFDPNSKRVAKDWILPKGLIDVQGVDFYPTSLKAQAAGVARIKAFVKQAGLTRYLIGEYGVDKTNPTLGVQLIREFKAAMTDAEALIYWSAQDKPTADNPNPVDYRFTSQTADAWFA